MVTTIALILLGIAVAWFVWRRLVGPGYTTKFVNVHDQKEYVLVSSIDSSVGHNVSSVVPTDKPLTFKNAIVSFVHAPGSSTSDSIRIHDTVLVPYLRAFPPAQWLEEEAKWNSQYGVTRRT